MRGSVPAQFVVTLLALTGLAGPELVSIRVTPRVLLAGQAIRIVCLVPRAARNRSLTLAVEGYRTSTWQLDGDEAPAVFERTFEHVPCGVERASCLLQDEVGRGFVAGLPIEVRGCDGP